MSFNHFRAFFLIFFMNHLVMAVEGLDEDDFLLSDEPIEVDDALERPIFFTLQEKGHKPLRIQFNLDDLNAAGSPFMHCLVRAASRDRGPQIEVILPVESIESFLLVIKFLRNESFSINNAQTLAHLIGFAHKFDLKIFGAFLSNFFDDFQEEFDENGLDLIAEQLRLANSGRKISGVNNYWAEQMSVKFGEHILRKSVMEDHDLYQEFKQRHKKEAALIPALTPSLKGLSEIRKTVSWQKAPQSQQMRDDKPDWLKDAELHARKNRKASKHDDILRAQKIAQASLSIITEQLADQTLMGQKKKIYLSVPASLAFEIGKELKNLSQQQGASLLVKIDPDIPLYDAKIDMLEHGSGIIKQAKCNKWQTGSFGTFLPHCAYCTSRTIGCALCPVQALTCGWCFCGLQKTNFPYDCINAYIDCRTADAIFFAIHESCTCLHSGCKNPERTLVIETRGW